MTNTISYQHLLNTNYNTIEYGYTGSRGDIGYTGSGYSLNISNVIITDSNFTSSNANVISSLGGFLQIHGTGFELGCNVFYSNNLVPDVEAQSTVNSSETVNLIINAVEPGNYNLFLYNPTGTTAIKLNAFTSE